MSSPITSASPTAAESPITSASPTTAESPTHVRHVDIPRRIPFPHTVEVAFDSTTSSPALLFNFAHSARSHIGDVTKAAAFHASSPISTVHDPRDRTQNKIVRVSYPPGLKRLYFARAGNVGLEFEEEKSLKTFQEGILGVGHVVVREEMGIYRCYLGDKIREDGAGRAGLVHQVGGGGGGGGGGVPEDDAGAARHAGFARGEH